MDNTPAIEKGTFLYANKSTAVLSKELPLIN